MNALKLFRTVACANCAEYETQAPWPKCNGNGRELNNGAFDGPESDCPQGHWQNVDFSNINLWAKGADMGTPEERRRAACDTCEHLVMKAGFNFAHCRYPGTNMRLGPEHINGPVKLCPTGQWAALDGYTDAQTRFADKEKVRADVASRNKAVAMAHERGKICDKCDGAYPAEAWPEGYKCSLKDCKACRRRNLLSRPGMTCPAPTPKWGPVDLESADPTEPPPDDSRIRVVWTISSYNESLLGETVRQLYDSVIDPHIDFSVVVVDDGSTDDSCADLPCHVIRNETSLGIGLNLNTAADYAIDVLKADVVGVADAHMRIPNGAVGALVRRAIEAPSVVCSYSRGYNPDSNTRGRGAYLVWQKENSLEPKWMGEKWPKLPDLDRPGKLAHRPAEEWAQVQVALGAFYAYSAETVAILKGPTGRLWETTVGRWGCLLAPFSVKCMLMGMPVYVSRDVWVGHLYRRSNPIPASHAEKVYNVAHGFSSILSQETFDNYTRAGFPGFHAWCVSRGNIDKQKVEAMIIKGRKGVKRPWTPEQEREILDAFPALDHKDGKHEANPVPLEKLMLPKRDKMVRAKKNKLQ